MTIKLADAKKAESDIESLKNPNAIEPASIKPYYEVTAKGIYYFAVKDGIHTAPLLLADAIYLIGRGVDSNHQHYRIIQWQDRFNRQLKTDVLDMSIIGTNQGWQSMQGMGITILSGRQKRELLADYLQTQGQNDFWHVTSKAGWCNSAYILPSGEVLQVQIKSESMHAPKPLKVIYHGDLSQANGYLQAGTLEQWQENISAYATENSRLCFALGVALAAPLMRLLDIEGGGFHLFGDSSDGKTTTAKVALSVWGKPDDLKLSWEGTGLGFSNLAHAKNDGLMVLDEIGQASPRVVSHTAYSVINGTGKAQGHKDGGNRELNRWRVLVLSTGEKTLEGYLKAGKGEWNAGQANRLPSIPANAGKGFGVFDNLHHFSNGAELAEHLNHASNQYYGSAGRAFILEILKGEKKAKIYVQQAMQKFQAELPSLSGQARRVAMRFALVFSALELASYYNIIQQNNENNMASVNQCLQDWFIREGCGKMEDKLILEQAIAFMQQYSSSERFALYPCGQFDRTTTHNFAGYRKRGDIEADDKFYIVPAIFESEIAKSFDVAKVCEVLHAAGWLQRHDTAKEKRWKHKLFNKGRYYLLLNALPPSELKDDENAL